jgi:two-component system, LytTR family, response regulator
MNPQRKLTAIIVDDEENSRLLIKSRIEKLFSNIEIVELCSNAQDAFMSIAKHKPDFICLDIQMPGMTGLEFLEFLNGLKPDLKVIIISAYNESLYFQKAIRSGVVDYLLKPFPTEELKQAILNVINKLNEHSSENQLRTIIKEISTEIKIQFKTPTSSLFINPKEIIYAHADGKFSNITLANENKEIICYGISNLNEELEKFKTFKKIDRFTIVNTDYIYKVHPKFKQIIFKINEKDLVLEVTSHGVERLLEIKH